MASVSRIRKGRCRSGRCRSEEGQSAVEFALVLPLLCVIVLGIIQLGIALNHYVTLTDATRVGARKAITTRLGGTTVADAQLAAVNAAGSLDTSKLDVTVTSSDWTQPGSEVVVTATYPYEVNLLGWVVASGNLTSTMKERLE
jgi:Flp pilus assembly protein TadG